MGILSGIIAGTILSLVGTFWLAQREKVRHEAILEEDETASSTNAHVVPLEKKLRDALYDCERNLLACQKQIHEICKLQLDLLQDVGKKSHVEVKNKPLFFEYYHPIQQERHFYYQKDLSPSLAPETLEKTLIIAQTYTQHIHLMLKQQELFQKLIESHQENLDRISGIKAQNNQDKKLSLHSDKLSQLDQDNQLETKAIYNKILIENINEELEHQEECLRQYIALNQQYEHPLDQQVEETFKTKIQTIIDQLESEDPSQSQQHPHQ